MRVHGPFHVLLGAVTYMAVGNMQQNSAFTAEMRRFLHNKARNLLRL